MAGNRLIDASGLDCQEMFLIFIFAAWFTTLTVKVAENLPTTKTADLCQAFAVLPGCIRMEATVALPFSTVLGGSERTDRNW